MILVVYDRKNHCLTMQGHACAAEKGHDIVCSAASVLAYTLAASVVNMDKLGRLENCVVRLDEGDTEINCKPGFAAECVATLIYDTICAGFELIAETYPDNVKYELVI